MTRGARFETVFPHLQALYYAAKAKWPENKFERWNRDQLLFRNRLEDIAIVWARMRSEYLMLKHKRTPVFASRKEFDRQWRVAWKLRVDMESFYVYADILLDKFVLLAAPAFGNAPRGVQLRSFGSFVDSTRGNSELIGPVSRYRDLHRESLELLAVRICYYRDRFIMHVVSPYQESTHFEPSRGLAVIRRRREDLDARWDSEAENLRGTLQSVLGLSKASGTHFIAQALFDNLHLVAPGANKQRAERLIQAVGVDSPPLFRLARQLVAFLQQSLDFLAQEISRQ